jgi:hypothetical protein
MDSPIISAFTYIFTKGTTNIAGKIPLCNFDLQLPGSRIIVDGTVLFFTNLFFMNPYTVCLNYINGELVGARNLNPYSKS